MGLDMYLRAEKYISGYNNDEQVKILLDLLGLEQSDRKFDNDGSFRVNISVGYWRKANAIHNWFVKNVQNGVDDCDRYYVDNEKLIELRNLCQKQIDNPNEDILSPTSGFFFGSTDKDEYYFGALKDTIDMMDFILNNPRFEDFSFYYQSSW